MTVAPQTTARRAPVAPRWRYQRRLWAPRNAVFWLFAGLVALAGVFTLVDHALFVMSAPAASALSWALLALYIVPVVLVVRALDLYEREPTSLMVAAFVWGATVAIAFSSIANVAWGDVITRLGGVEFSAEWSAAMTAPVIEEIYKYLGVIVIYLIARTEIDDLMDGFVFGALVGLGFSVVEDVYYFMGHFGGDITGVLQGFWVRVIASGLYGHVLYTGLSGIGLAYFVTHRDDRPFARRVLVALSLLLLAMAAHFFWNAPWFWAELPLLVATTLKGMPLLLFVVLAVRLARRREHRWLRVALEREVDRGGVSQAEVDVLADPGRRKALRKATRRAAGKDAERLLSRLHREQINLAMVATRVDDPVAPDLLKQRALCESLRTELHRRSFPPPSTEGSAG